MRQLAPWTVAALVAGAAVTAPAVAYSEDTWTFKGISVIEIDGISGDVLVRSGKGSGLVVTLEQDVRPADAFEGTVDEDGSTLRLKEKWGRGRSSGHVNWTLEIPPSFVPMIEIDTSSGSLEAIPMPA